MRFRVDVFAQAPPGAKRLMNGGSLEAWEAFRDTAGEVETVVADAVRAFKESGAFGLGYKISIEVVPVRDRRKKRATPVRTG
jgi:hypothetical protein